MQHTADEKGVSRKDGFVVAIFEQVADAVLGVAGCVQCLDLDVAYVECLTVCGCLGNFAAVLSANDWDGVCLELGECQLCIL